jgi:2-polyprenyl-3-methyl-5-hydroxy-6-metoxy-1,4-benzoquinol methylase
MQHGLYYYCIYFQKRKKEINTLIFLWLHNQTFYKNLQKKALEPIGSTSKFKEWADIGCSTGLMSRLAKKKNYTVMGYDLNYFSLLLAKLLSFTTPNLQYKQQDFNTIEKKFDVITATSLLSVVKDKQASFDKLLSLLRNNDSILIIIEPTKNLNRKNVWALIHDFKTFWHYKGLLLWAKARENKDIDKNIFNKIFSENIFHTYDLDNMVRISYISKS